MNIRFCHDDCDYPSILADPYAMFGVLTPGVTTLGRQQRTAALGRKPVPCSHANLCQGVTEESVINDTLCTTRKIVLPG